MKLGFIIDNRKCIGCHACTVACKSEYDTPIGVNRTWVKYVEKGTFPDTRRFFTVHRCNHCEDAPCVEICPVTSLFVRPDGIVDFDPLRCIGCKACMQACPYDALHIDPRTRTASKCNYCAHRVDRGLQPACVVVCPVQAIISGDLEDPQSDIARLASRHVLMARKPEKNTRPKLFYIEADGASIRPEEAPPGPYTVTGQSAGVGHFAGKPFAHDESGKGQVIPYPTHLTDGTAHSSEAAPRRTYDTPERGVLWGWEVSGYLWTKSIAAGVLVIPLLLNLLGMAGMERRFEMALALISLAFLGLTGGLLVKDLDQPWRFLYVMLRPQWRSWLVRGAWIIMGFGGVTTLWLALLWLEPASAPPLRIPLVALGLLTAIYTAFLLAQAKGRDLWQSPLLPFRMAVSSAMTGSAAVLLIGWVAGAPNMPWVHSALIVAVIVHLGIAAAELFTPHVTGDTARAMAIISQGSLKWHFRSALALGNLLPLVLLSIEAGTLPMVAAAGLVLIFALVFEHVWVRAPQLIPLS